MMRMAQTGREALLPMLALSSFGGSTMMDYHTLVKSASTLRIEQTANLLGLWCMNSPTFWVFRAQKVSSDTFRETFLLARMLCVNTNAYLDLVLTHKVFRSTRVAGHIGLRQLSGMSY